MNATQDWTKRRWKQLKQAQRKMTELRVMGRTYTVWGEFRVEPKWSAHLVTMPHGGRLGEVFQAYQTGTRTWGRPRTRWRDYIFHLALESLRILPTRLLVSRLRSCSSSHPPGQPGHHPDIWKRSTRNKIKCSSNGDVLKDCCSNLKQQIVAFIEIWSWVVSNPRKSLFHLLSSSLKCGGKWNTQSRRAKSCSTAKSCFVVSKTVSGSKSPSHHDNAR